MTIENMQKFIEKAGEDDALLSALSQKLEAAESGKEAAAVVQLGSKHGFQFTEAEALQAYEFLKLSDAKSSGDELTDEQLEMVAGGGWLGDAAGWVQNNERSITRVGGTVIRVLSTW